VTTDSAAAPPAPPQYSADGQWWWTGAEWISLASKAEQDSMSQEMPAPAAATLPPSYYPAPVPTTNGLAIASLVLGIVWLSGLGSLLAVIFGHVARGQIKRTGQRGQGLATAGLILGYLGLAVIAALVLILGVFAAHAAQTQQTASGDASVRADLRNAATVEESYYTDMSAYTADRAALAADSNDFVANTGNSIVIGVDAPSGYCVVGTHTGSGSWFLYDSVKGGMNETPFRTQADAQTACSDAAISEYGTLAGAGS